MYDEKGCVIAGYEAAGKQREESLETRSSRRVPLVTSSKRQHSPSIPWACLRGRRGRVAKKATSTRRSELPEVSSIYVRMMNVHLIYTKSSYPTPNPLPPNIWELLQAGMHYHGYMACSARASLLI
jgi:hypothetical protein